MGALQNGLPAAGPHIYVSLSEGHMAQVVRLSRKGALALVEIDSPPVNAMSQDMRQGLLDAFTSLQSDRDVKAVLIHCAGRTFVSGADLREFDIGVGEPNYHLVFGLIENFDRPVIAALHGTAMGAGVEIALACHYRCASPDAKLGLPEITLGIIPGAGGTQRLPRLIGAKAAADIILNAAPIAAGKAKELVIIDEVINGDLLAGAIAYAEKLIASDALARPTAARAVDATGFDDAYIAAALKDAGKKWRGQQAPKWVLDAIKVSLQMPVNEGVKREREISLAAEQSLESRSLRHLFFAEREVARIPGLSADVKPKDIQSVAIIGAGTMGRGIAICFADAGVRVQLIDTTVEAAAKALDAIGKTYDSSVAKGRLSADDKTQRMARIQAGADIAAVSTVDLVVEAAFESMEVKKDLFGKFDKLCRPDAILATNTSTLDIDAIAAMTSRPEQVLGLHFFSPANVMRLLEIVRGAKTSPTALATAVALGKKLRKVGVVAGVCYGFIGNRMMLEGYVREADQLLLEGATPEQIDRVMLNFGMAMGPCTMNDMAGNDVALKSREVPGVRDGKPRPYNEVIDTLARMNRLGQKTGAGFYKYLPGDRTTHHDPVTDEVIEKLAKELNITRRTISDEEVEMRCIYPLINEGAKILDEGIAYRAGDIDTIWTTGYGFPRFRGGPMFYADSLGLQNVYDRIVELHAKHGHYWKPAPLLEKLAKSGGTFAKFKSQA
jgi:3-hydroxyacyl-CoA dehydrogenase